jgi:hypothetical protein
MVKGEGVDGIKSIKQHQKKFAQRKRARIHQNSGVDGVWAFERFDKTYLLTVSEHQGKQAHRKKTERLGLSLIAVLLCDDSDWL